MAEAGLKATRSRLGWRVKAAGLTLLIVLVAVVVLQNGEQTEFKVLFWRVTMPLALMLALTLLVGAAAGAVAAVMLRRKGK